MAGLGVEYAAIYTLTGPDGTVAVFNDSSSGNYVGMLSPESSGLDSADVREDASDATEEDGGTHGNFYYGRRPVILQGTVIASSKADRAEKIAKIKRASNALRANAQLTWTDIGGASVILLLRRQQPVRFTKGYVKDFMIPMVSASAYIQSKTVNKKSYAVANTGRKYPGTVAEHALALGSAGAWTNPNNVKASDDVRATSTTKLLSGVFYTNEIRGSNFTFALPTGSSVLGFKAYFEGKRSAGTVISVYDAKLLIAGERAGTVFGTWEPPEGSDATKTYGSETTLFGTTPTYTVVNNAEFGLYVAFSAASERLMELDGISLEVFYLAPQTITNAGDAPAFPIVKVYGPGSVFRIENQTTGESLVLEGVALAGGEYLEVNFKNHTVKKNGVTLAYNAVVFASSKWWALQPGANTVAVAGGAAEVEWQDTYL